MTTPKVLLTNLKCVRLSGRLVAALPRISLQLGELSHDRVDNVFVGPGRGGYRGAPCRRSRVLGSVLRRSRRLNQLTQLSQLSRQAGVLFIELLALSRQLVFEIRSATPDSFELLGEFIPFPAKHLDFTYLCTFSVTGGRCLLELFSERCDEFAELGVLLLEFLHLLPPRLRWIFLGLLIPLSLQLPACFLGSFPRFFRLLPCLFRFLALGSPFGQLLLGQLTVSTQLLEFLSESVGFALQRLESLVSLVPLLADRLSTLLSLGPIALHLLEPGLELRQLSLVLFEIMGQATGEFSLLSELLFHLPPFAPLGVEFSQLSRVVLAERIEFLEEIVEISLEPMIRLAEFTRRGLNPLPLFRSQFGCKHGTPMNVFGEIG